MSLIAEAIKRISIVAEQNNHRNLPGSIMYERDTSNPSIPHNIIQRRYYSENRCLQPQDLTQEQIKELTKQYRFKLPQEFYDLYQIGNGCLPIGISPENNWDSIYNYFYFPNINSSLWNIHNIMNFYKSSLINCNPQLLCICSYGDESGLFLVGNETEQETGAVVWTYGADMNDDITNMEVLWSSLTNMILTYAEIYEEKYQRQLTEQKIKAIYKKYGGNAERKFLRFYFGE
ncbi:MAG: SMI1/KNR4 family protein [Cyanobacteria bacterium J06582_2]